MNEMQYRKKLLNDVNILDDRILDAFNSSTVKDTVWMKDGNSTLFEEICHQIRKWIKEL